MIKLEKDEEIENAYMCYIKEFGEGILYCTTQRACFDSYKHGMCFTRYYEEINICAYYEKEVYIEWIEPTMDGLIIDKISALNGGYVSTKQVANHFFEHDVAL